MLSVDSLWVFTFGCFVGFACGLGLSLLCIWIDARNERKRKKSCECLKAALHAYENHQACANDNDYYYDQW